jgi:hypothetical protein
MSYIEITIWNPFRKGNFSWQPRLEKWTGSEGFEVSWLCFDILVSLDKEY